MPRKTKAQVQAELDAAKLESLPPRPKKPRKPKRPKELILAKVTHRNPDGSVSTHNISVPNPPEKKVVEAKEPLWHEKLYETETGTQYVLVFGPYTSNRRQKRGFKLAIRSAMRRMAKKAKRQQRGKHNSAASSGPTESVESVGPDSSPEAD